MRGAKQVAMVLVAMVAFVGLWLLLAPFFGPPGTFDGSPLDRRASVRTGGRGLCAPPLIARVTGGGSDKQLACQTVGVGRLETGLMLLGAAFVGAAATARMFRDPAAPKPRWEH
jgi:hypothetical protein